MYIYIYIHTYIYVHVCLYIHKLDTMPCVKYLMVHPCPCKVLRHAYESDIYTYHIHMHTHTDTTSASGFNLQP